MSIYGTSAKTPFVLTPFGSCQILEGSQKESQKDFSTWLVHKQNEDNSDNNDNTIHRHDNDNNNINDNNNNQQFVSEVFTEVVCLKS